MSNEEKNTPIQGSIAYVLSPNLIVINVGSAHGVPVGKRCVFQILGHVVAITDPNTKAVILPELFVSKGELVVAQVSELCSICYLQSTYRIRQRTRKANSAFAEFTSEEGTIEEAVDPLLAITHEDGYEGFWTIKRGDTVLQVDLRKGPRSRSTPALDGD